MDAYVLDILVSEHNASCNIMYNNVTEA